MNQYGLKSLGIRYLLGKESLKKNFLYFDKLLFDYEEFERSLWQSEYIGEKKFGKERTHKLMDKRIDEISFLAENDLIEKISSNEIENDAHWNFDLSEFYSSFTNINRNSLPDFPNKIHISELRSLNTNLIDGIEKSSFRTYFLSNLIEHMYGIKTTPILENQIIFNDNIAQEYDVVNIVLKSFPIIDENTNWEKVLDFKTDKDSKLKFLALRNWMIDIAKGNYSKTDISEKLEFLYFDYINHIEKHHLKIKKGNLKTFITSSAEILEDIVTIKWSKAINSIFDFFETKNKLVEIKAVAPGKEIAYIVDANDKF